MSASATDRFGSMGAGLTSPGAGGFAITPSDTNELEQVTRGLYVGGSGDLHVALEDGSELTFADIAAGVIHPLRVRQVFDDSTASGLIGIY